MKDKKCKVCNKLFNATNSIQKVCSINCAIEFAKKATVKDSLIVQKQEKKAWEFRKNEMKEKNLCLKYNYYIKFKTHLKFISWWFK